MNKKIVIALIAGAMVLLGGAFYLKSIVPSETDVSKNLERFLAKEGASEEVRQAYRFALENPQGVLSQVKCYCGCLKQDHKNNRDCFINEDGTFDLMGLNCGLCVKTALVSKEMLSEGKSVQEISDYVDNRWGKND